MKLTKLPGAIVIAACSAALLAACGGSDGGGGSGNTAFGISGSGYSKGAIQRFGSIIVNGREYEITASTQVFVDDKKVGEGKQAVHRYLAVGNVVEIKATFNGNRSATANKVYFDPELEGPISSINPANNSFVVAAQTVLVSGATVFEDTTFESLLNRFRSSKPTVVEVSGTIDAQGRLRASSVDLQQDPDHIVEVKGTVKTKNLNREGQTFTINGLTVDFTGVDLEPTAFFANTPGPWFVEAEGTLANGTLDAQEVELEEGIPAESGEAVELESIVESVPAEAAGYDFKLVGGQKVAYDSNTAFEEGDRSAINKGVAIEVTGVIDSNGILQARKIELEVEPEVEVAALVDDVNDKKGTITLLGDLIFQATNETRIKDDRDDQAESVTVKDIQKGAYVEIAASVDASGDLIAVRIERD